MLATNAYVFMATLLTLNPYNVSYMPKTYMEAILWADLYMLAIQEELRIMMERGVIKLVPRSGIPETKKIIGCQ